MLCVADAELVVALATVEADVDILKGEVDCEDVLEESDRVEDAADVLPSCEAEEEDLPIREPVPHGIFSPSGWVDWDGVTTLSDESVMVKRPVQVLFDVAGDENW